MDRWLVKIVALLDDGNREQRRAAARVLEALKPAAPEVVEALGRALGREERQFRSRALEALGAISGPGIVPHLLPLLDEEGELGRRAAELLADADPKVMAAVKKRFGAAGPTARRRMLAIAVYVGGADGMSLIIKALERGHTHEVLQIGERLAQQMEAATSRERNTLFRRIDAFLASAAAGKDPDASGAAVDMLARILGPQAAPRLLNYASPSNPPFVRRRALEALARVAPQATFEESELSTILGYLGELDYSNVVAPSMAVLERAKLSPSHAAPILKCLRGHDPALRRFAVSALGQVDTPKSAAALLDVLQGGNPDLKKRAAISLAKQHTATAQLAAALVQASDSQTAWILARILHPNAAKLKPEPVGAIAKAAAAWLEPGDPRAEALVSVLADRHLAQLADQALKRVKRAKRDRDAGAVVNLLRPLMGDRFVASPDMRYEIALAELVRGKKDVVREMRLQNVGLQALERLAHEAEFDLQARLRREKGYLSTEEYFLIGCHFAERPFQDREFGGELLRWIAKTFPGDTFSQAAASKLTMEGFPPPPQPRKKAAPKKPKKRPPAPTAVAKAAPKKKVAAKKAPAAKKAATKAPAKKNAPAPGKAAKAPAKKRSARR